LSPAQRAEFERTGTFTVRGSCGGRYRVGESTCFVRRYARTWLFRWLPFERRNFWHWHVGRWPKEDAWLAHKLLLEADEQWVRVNACTSLYG